MAKSRKTTKATKATKGRHLPVVIGFFVCEKAMVEPDQVISAIRIVDTVTLPSEVLATVKKGEAVGTQLALVLILKSGDARGEYAFRWRLLNPSGRREEVGTWKYTFAEPPEGGYSIRAPVVIKWDKPGLYWYEVYVGQKLIVRTPMLVKVAAANPPEEGLGRKKGS